MLTAIVVDVIQREKRWMVLAATLTLEVKRPHELKFEFCEFGFRVTRRTTIAPYLRRICFCEPRPVPLLREIESRPRYLELVER